MYRLVKFQLNDWAKNMYIWESSKCKLKVFVSLKRLVPLLFHYVVVELASSVGNP